MRFPRLSRGRRSLGVLGVVGLIVAFCLGLVWRNPGVFWNDDYQISILPTLADVARSWREGHWPLLSPYSWACGNLAGEYQYGTFSLFVNAVVVLVFALWSGFAAQAAALSIIHLAVLGAGAYLLARGRRLPAALATVVGLIAALNGWEIGWGASDWFGALAADAWLPWAWWAFERALRPGTDTPRGRLWWLLPGPFVYLVLTGGFPYTVVRLVLVTAWLGVHAISARRWRALWPLAIGWLGGLLLAAPAWLSLLAYIRGSHRSEGAGLDKFAWTVPLHAWPGLILPDWTVNWHDFANRPSSHAALELIGGLVPLAGLVAAFARRRGRAWRLLRWDLLLLGGVVLLCVLPSPGMFRWSFRWLPLFHLVFALVGARALHTVLSRHGVNWRSNAGLWAAGMIGAVWLAMVAAHTSSPDAITRFLPAWTLGIAVAWCGLAAFVGRRRGALWLPLVATLTSLWAAYAHMYTNAGVPIYGFGPGVAQVAPLSPDRLYLSLYRVPFHHYWAYQTGPDFGAVVRPGSTGMFAGIHTVNGYSPIMPAGVGRSWNMETHGSIPEDVGRRLLKEEAGSLELLGVDGILIAHDFPLEDVVPPPNTWEKVYTSAEGTVYHRRGGALPEIRAWEEGVASPAIYERWDLGPHPAPKDDVQIRQVRSSRSEISLEVTVPPNEGTAVALAFRRPFFPGYLADLDGTSIPVIASDGLFPSVRLPAGAHGRLSLRYRPPAVVLGTALAGAGLLGMAGFALWTVRRFKAG